MLRTRLDNEPAITLSRLMNYITFIGSLASIVGSIIYGTWVVQSSLANTEKRITLIENNSSAMEKRFDDISSTLLRHEEKIDKIYFLMSQGSKYANANERVLQTHPRKDS